jgi:hypothetical protein
VLQLLSPHHRRLNMVAMHTTCSQVSPILPLQSHRRSGSSTAAPASPCSLAAAAAADAYYGQQPLLPLPLTSAGVPPATLADLRRRQLLAAEAEDYHAAAALKQLARTLGSRSRPPPRLPAGASAQERARYMFEHGFLVIEDAFSGDQLRRLQAAWKRVQQPLVTRWRLAKAAGVGSDGRHHFANGEELMQRFGINPTRLFIDVPIKGVPPGHVVAPLVDGATGKPVPEVRTFFSEAMEPDGDPVLLDLIDPPALVPVLRAYLGEGVKLCGVQPRTYASDHDLDPHARGYTTWHRDGSAPDGFERPSPAHDIKVFIYFEDVAPDGGCTSVVPGTHKLAHTAAAVFGPVFHSAYRDSPEAHLSQESMPNMFRFAVKAGTVCAFDTAIWHTALGNASGRARENVIMGYNTVTPLRNTGGLMTADMLTRLQELGRLDGDDRRQLLGLGQTLARYASL